MYSFEKFRHASTLVTGGAGFIGSHICDALLANGAQVVCLDNFDSYYIGKESNLVKARTNSNFKLASCDITDSKLEETIRNQQYDFIFHCAAQPGVRYSLSFPEKVFRVNFMGSINILEFARKHDIGKVVIASTSSVYGNATKFPVPETAELNPISPYGLSKMLMEKACKHYAELYGLDVVILRYHTVYGPRQRPDMAIRKWITSILKGERPTIYGDGKQSRDFTYVKDIVTGTLLAALNGSSMDIFNLGSGKQITIHEVVGKIFALVNIKNEPIYESKKQGDVQDTYADITSAGMKLGYLPETKIDDGLKAELDWLKTIPAV